MRNDDQLKTIWIEKKCNELYQKAGLNIRRTDDAVLQKRGVDFYLNDWIVDEKAAIHYWNKNLQTYCFECSTLNNKNGEGWLFHSDSLTTHYALVYVGAKDEWLNVITSLEVLFVPKKSVMSYLANMGLDTPKKVERMLWSYGDKLDGKIEYKVSEKVKITQNLKFRNHPTNIIINKSLLYSWSQKILHS